MLIKSVRSSVTQYIRMYVKLSCSVMFVSSLTKYQLLCSKWRPIKSLFVWSKYNQYNIIVSHDHIVGWYKQIGTSSGIAFSPRYGGGLVTTHVDRYFHYSFLFYFPFFSDVNVFHGTAVWIINLFIWSWSQCQTPKVAPISTPCSQFWSPHFGFYRQCGDANGAALQAVWSCWWWATAPFTARLLLELGAV